MLKDSGSRSEFETGAVRDGEIGKGRCDLLPLNIISNIMKDDILQYIHNYIWYGNEYELYDAIDEFVKKYYNNCKYTAFLELAKQYEDGAVKYGDRNWEKGIPSHRYIDSAIRHYLKFSRGDKDEPHDRAFLWNVVGALWTQKYKPEMNDLPFGDEKNDK